MKKMMIGLVSLLAGGVFGAGFAGTLDTRDLPWQSQRVSATLAAPDAAAWKTEKNGWRRVPGKTTPRSSFSRVWEPGGTWKRCVFAAPADWRGAFVRLELDSLSLVDASTRRTSIPPR